MELQHLRSNDEKGLARDIIDNEGLNLVPPTVHIHHLKKESWHCQIS